MAAEEGAEQFWVAGATAPTADHLPGRCADCGVAVYYSAACKPARLAVICLGCCQRRFGDEAGRPAVLESTLDEIADVLGITTDEAFTMAERQTLAQYGKRLQRIKG